MAGEPGGRPARPRYSLIDRAPRRCSQAMVAAVRARFGRASAGPSATIRSLTPEDGPRGRSTRVGSRRTPPALSADRLITQCWRSPQSTAAAGRRGIASRLSLQELGIGQRPAPGPRWRSLGRASISPVMSSPVGLCRPGRPGGGGPATRRMAAAGGPGSSTVLSPACRSANRHRVTAAQAGRHRAGGQLVALGDGCVEGAAPSPRLPQARCVRAAGGPRRTGPARRFTGYRSVDGAVAGGGSSACGPVSPDPRARVLVSHGGGAPSSWTARGRPRAAAGSCRRVPGAGTGVSAGRAGGA